MKTVAHFIRKSSQLRASFINNQISNHINYKPVIVYRYESKKEDGGFAEFNRKDSLTLNLSEGKLLNTNYRYLRKISIKDTKRVIMFLKEQNVSILHFHYGSDARIYSDVIKNSGIPSIVSFYGYDAFSFKNLLFGYGKKLLNDVFDNATLILAMTEEMKADLIKINCPRAKLIVHYHGVPANRIVPKDYLTPSKKRAFTLLIISYLDPVKGHLLVLESIKKLVNDGITNIDFRIVGEGYYKSRLKKYVQHNKLDPYVTFVGKLDYLSNEMLNEFAKADVFIHPSVTTRNDKEGIPGTIVEAMMAGLPVISTYHGGIPYVIKNMETGLLVNEWDTNDLCNKIKQLMMNKELRQELGNAAKDYSINNLNLTLKQQELENIYNSLTV